MNFSHECKIRGCRRMRSKSDLYCETHENEQRLITAYRSRRTAELQVLEKALLWREDVHNEKSRAALLNAVDRYLEAVAADEFCRSTATEATERGKADEDK